MINRASRDVMNIRALFTPTSIQTSGRISCICSIRSLRGSYERLSDVVNGPAATTRDNLPSDAGTVDIGKASLYMKDNEIDD